MPSRAFVRETGAVSSVSELRPHCLIKGPIRPRDSGRPINSKSRVLRTALKADSIFKARALTRPMVVSATISAVPIAGHIVLRSFLARPGGFPDRSNLPTGRRTLQITMTTSTIIDSPPKLLTMGTMDEVSIIGAIPLRYPEKK